MSVDDRPALAASPARHTAADDYTARAGELVMSLVREPWGQVSPSVYETARLVALAPWLTGHEERLTYLLGAQREDGGWGGPGGYALVPTLSAVDALLDALRFPPEGVGHATLARSAERGLRMLSSLLPSLSTGDGGEGTVDVPDTPALDIITVSLTSSIAEHLSALRERDPEGREPGPSWTLPDLPGFGRDRLDLVLAALDAGAALPGKVFHALEVAGAAAVGAVGVPPAPTGTVGASPAATAAWSGGREPGASGERSARRYLETVVRKFGGPVPCGLPITVFERSWVIGGLLRAGLSPAVPARLSAELAAALGPGGTPAAAGLPADADTTAMTLYALSLLGVRRTPDALLRYELETHFCTWQGENGHSTSVNAHVLDAFGQYLRETGERTDGEQDASHNRFVAAVRKLSSWLCAEQREDGSWHDRWHASPYYATVCCTLALSDFGVGDAGAAVGRAVAWVLATQRPDGSWGIWGGTAEETAYALQILLLAGASGDLATERAVTAGHRYLLRAARQDGRPALWHDKDLYLPAAVVEAEILAALHLAAGRSAGRGSLPARPTKPQS
ncbi:prenyltransferase/squalene oxidase repeat-containing protein [Spirillospora sp. CA-108201]